MTVADRTERDMRDTYDYVIVGTGAAGSVLAHSLPATSSILLVDIATHRPEPPGVRQPLPFVSQCPSHYTPAFSGVLGGNTALWSGKVYLPTPQELKDWPVGFEELRRFSVRLADRFGVPHSWLHDIRQYASGAVFHRSYRSNWGNLYEYLNLEHAPNVHVLEEHSLVGLTGSGGRVTSIELGSRQGRRKTVSIRHSVILAAGGLGNTHLLLNLLASSPESTGGRTAYGQLCDHLHFNVGRIGAVDPLANILKGYLQKTGNENGNLEDCLVLESDTGMVGVQIDAPGPATKVFRRAMYRTRYILKKVAMAFMDRHVNRWARRFARLAYRGTAHSPRSLELFFSQPPDDFNQVSLSSNEDEFGLKKINISHRLDAGTILGHQSQLQELLGANVQKLSLEKLGEKNVYTGLHPSCTTPIVGGETYGTLDTDLRVRGFENLYCVGSNVFPSNGITNPTWLIMVLAYRLAVTLRNTTEMVREIPADR